MPMPPAIFQRAGADAATDISCADPCPTNDNGGMSSDDPTRIRSQASLTTSTGRIWLIIGGLFTAISLALLIAMTQLPPPGVAGVAAVVVAVLYGAMVVVRLVTAPGRRRLTLLATGLLLIAAVSLIAVAIVAGSARVA